eukprot:TRINITY_DN4968_c0_g1_i3.p1 TRINITY_DN4968_c0_g1~~TRINITY_DN4968_c0_g1_i3.p1  ORF type:complete len:428 (+),score=72.72 TRINITY_DN4968_c0_g1_i3:333-1616(+)
MAEKLRVDASIAKRKAGTPPSIPSASTQSSSAAKVSPGPMAITPATTPGGNSYNRIQSKKKEKEAFEQLHYKKLTASWRELAPRLEWIVRIKQTRLGPISFLQQPDMAKYEDQDFVVPATNVNIYNEGVLFRLDPPKDLLLTVPFEIGLLTRVQLPPTSGDDRQTGQTFPLHGMETLWGPRGSSWAWLDRGCKMKLFMEKVDVAGSGSNASNGGDGGGQATYRIHSVAITFHAQKVLQQVNPRSHRPIEPKQKSVNLDSCYGLQGFSIYVSLRPAHILRGEDTPSLLLHTGSLRQNVCQAESPFEYTVFFNVSTFPILLPFNLTDPKDKDHLSLIADVTMFDKFSQVFWCRSSFLFVQPHYRSQAHYEATMLSHESHWISFMFEKRENDTVALSCKVVVPLSRINRWFKRRYKLMHVSMLAVGLEGN